MKRICVIGLACLLCMGASANDEATLALSSVEVERLGIAFSNPVEAASVTVGSGPAKVVVPPAQQVVVGASVDGILSRLLVAEGETVAAGQALAEIQSQQFLQLQRAYIDAVSGNQLASAQLRRDVGLREDGIIAERRLQETSASAAAASATLEQLRQQLRLAGLSTEQLARLADRRELGTTMTLRSPLDGVVVSQLGTLGERVDALAPVFRIADLTTLWLEIRVSEQQSRRVSEGMQIALSTPDERLFADVFHVGPVVDEASQTVMIRAAVNNERLSLRPGRFLTVRIVATASGAEPTYVTPASAVFSEGGKTFIFVRSANGVTAQPVRLLSEDGGDRYIASPARLDAPIVTAGVAALKSLWLEAGAPTQ